MHIHLYSFFVEVHAYVWSYYRQRGHTAMLLMFETYVIVAM